MWTGWPAIRKDDMGEADLASGGKLQPEDAPRFKRKRPKPTPSTQETVPSTPAS